MVYAVGSSLSSDNSVVSGVSASEWRIEAHAATSDEFSAMTTVTR